MGRSTIDFGIDLGTTNSSVAVIRGTGTEVVKNNDDRDITSSAVLLDRRGSVYVGHRAKQALEKDESADDVQIEFKRLMGQDHVYTFRSAGKSLKPEDLSAEVLKEMRGNVQQRLGEEIQAAVITVPAAFELKQCAATRAAGELAGLSPCPLLQEPVAAALAYGFQADAAKEYWLVYDFGGGTFDAAIIKAEDGSISVVNHGGDNFLGGSDIDRAIVEQLVIPRLKGSYNLRGLAQGAKQWKTAFAVLKRAVEEAKIELSRKETAYLPDCRIKDADGKLVDVDIQLTRQEVVGVAEPIIMRSIDICRRVLEEKGLAASAVERVILVGGPTLAPYFREIVKTELGIPLDHSVDPLTVVARGAAIFAGTQRLEGKAGPGAAAGQYDVELVYKAIGAEEDPTVRGRVSAPGGESVEGFTLEFVNETSNWRSGKLTLKADGKLKVNLLAERGKQNVFVLELRDTKGTKHVTVPDRLSYTIGLAISEQPLLNPVAIALANNETDFFFRKGEPLPAKATRVRKAAHAVRKGHADDTLMIPVVEGENPLADRNRLLGHLRIDGSMVRRDIPAGTDVEITLTMDASRLLHLKAYLPILDEEFEAKIEESHQHLDEAELKKELAAEKKRLAQLREKADADEDGGGTAVLDEIDEGGAVKEVEGLVGAAGDAGAARKAEHRLLELKVKLDEAEEALKWPALVQEVREALDQLDQLVEKYGDSDQEAKASLLREEIEELIEQKRAERLRKKLDQVHELQYDILVEQPGWWIGFLNYLIGEQGRMSDRAAASRLIAQGKQCIESNNLDGLKQAVRQLLRLLPPDAAAEAERGYGGGLVR